MSIALRTSCLAVLFVAGCSLYDPDLYKNRTDGAMEGGTDANVDGSNVDPNDVDGDGVANAEDDCPNNYDPGQYDLDADALGNACDDDGDGDGIADQTVMAGSYRYADVLDYLIQNTCVDTGTNQPVADDPFDCVSRGRKIRNHALGEKLLIYRHDQADGSNAFGTQAMASIPYRLGAGATGVINMLDNGGGANAYREYDRNGTFSATNPANTVTNHTLDGYELVELGWTGASIYGAANPYPTGVQLLQGRSPSNPNACLLDDSLLLVRMDRVPLMGGTQNAIAEYRASSTCPLPSVQLDSHFTQWTVNEEFEFTVGRTMDALITESYTAASIDASDGFDRVYFTRPYGKTRWERWSKTGVEDATGCNGDTSDSRGFKRTACREWTVVVNDPEDGYDPRAWPVDSRIGYGNLLVNGDFGAQSGLGAAWVASDVSEITMTPTDVAAGSLLERNTKLVVRWTSAADSTKRWIYQDIVRSAIGAGTYDVGVGLRASASQLSALTVRVRYFGPPPMNQDLGTVVLYDGGQTTTTTTRLEFMFTMPNDSNVNRVRLEIEPGRRNADFTFDDFWLTRL